MAAKKSPLNAKLIIIIVVLVVVGLGAYLLMGNKGDKTGDSKTSNASSAFSSIKDALSKSVSLECDFTDSMGRTSKVWIKNGAMRGEYTGDTKEESGNMIIKDKKMYFWNDMMGIVMDVPEGEEWDSDMMESESNQGQDFLKEIEQYKDSCKPAVVSDSIFTPPTDVDFQDFSKMMQPNQNGGQMTEEDVKKMMEQYQQ